MVVAFFESIKYVGHLFPVAFLRVYLGYYWIKEANSTYRDGLFSASVYLEELKIQISQLNLPGWYESMFNSIIIPNWHTVSNVIVGAQFMVGLALVLGFFVRPMCLIGIIISCHYAYLAPAGEIDFLYMTFVAIFLTLFWVGAGRCLGFDYFFYKRKRGIWW